MHFKVSLLTACHDSEILMNTGRHTDYVAAVDSSPACNILYMFLMPTGKSKCHQYSIVYTYS